MFIIVFISDHNAQQSWLSKTSWMVISETRLSLYKYEAVKLQFNSR